MAEAKKKFDVLPVHKRPGAASAVHGWRALKYAAPQCPDCQAKNQRGWWKDCTHNPYITKIRTDVHVPVIKCVICNEEVDDGTITHCGAQDFEQTGEKIKPKFTPQLNIREVRLDESVNGGRSPELYRSRGWVPAVDKGVAPMCEMSRCYQPLTDENGKNVPGIAQTTFGNYCSIQHARMVALSLSPEAIEVFDQRVIAKQLSELGL